MASSSGGSPAMQTYAVTVPPGIGPGQQFQASLDGQLTMVIVPHGSGPNSTLHVQIPVRPSNVQKYAVTIPNGVQPGGRFQANLGGQLVWLNCPRNLGPGKQMLVDAASASKGSSGGKSSSTTPELERQQSLLRRTLSSRRVCRAAPATRADRARRGAVGESLRTSGVEGKQHRQIRNL